MLIIVILSILATWVFCAAVCVGIGAALLRAMHFTYKLTEAFWMGSAGIVLVLEMYHFFRPVDGIPTSILIALGIVGLVWTLQEQRSLWSDVWHQGLGQKTCFAGITTFVALRAAGPCAHYDTGMYGATAVRWIVTYPLVPGLGNLRSQLAFNTLVPLWNAVLDQGPWKNLSHHLFVGLLISALWTAIVAACFRLLRGKEVRATDWFGALLLIPASAWSATEKFVGVNTDLPATIVCIVAACEILQGLERNGDEVRRASKLLLGAVLLALAVTFKLSSLVFAVTGWWVACAAIWQMRSGRKRALIAAVILPAMLLVPWLVRGVILSGYAFFPSPMLALNVNWRIPKGTAILETNYVRTFARGEEMQAVVPKGFSWIKPWFLRVREYREGFAIPVILMLAGCLGVFWRRSQRSLGESASRWTWMLVPCVAGLAFWFVEAPALRFGEAVIWITAGILMVLGVFNGHMKVRTVRVSLGTIVVLAAWSVHPRIFWESRQTLFAVQGFEPLPKAEVAPHRLPSGLVVDVPITGNQCWGAALPCSFDFSQTLRLREPGDLAKGFAVDDWSAGAPTGAPSH